jgi:hypothetical protein
MPEPKILARLGRPLVLAAFFLCFFSSLGAEEIPCVWTGVEKIVAVGDLHGDYSNFVKILKATGMVKDGLHWAGGRTHLVQTGDAMDRGPDAKNILDLMIILEKEAKTAGGQFHFLIGNHEEMNITGITFDYPGNVSVEQFVSFLPAGYRQKREKEFRKLADKETSPGPRPLVDSVETFRKYWSDEIKNNPQARTEYLVNFNDKYGKWILRHNAVVKINDVVFAHGGISERFSKWKLKDINDTLRTELEMLRLNLVSGNPLPPAFTPKIVYVSDGPLWDRELAREDENAFQPEVDRILANLGAKYMVIAHTPHIVHSKKEMSRFQGKIWIIDTGISEVYGGHPSALIIEGDNFSVWGINNDHQESDASNILYGSFFGFLGFRFLPAG